MKNVVIVDLANHPTLALCPQLKTLPYRHIAVINNEEYLIVRHSAGEHKLVNGEIDSNYDFSIRAEKDNASWYGPLGTIPRGGKDKQVLEINKAGKDIPGFTPLRSYGEYDTGFDPEKAYVIKPNLGARGIGQVFVPVGTPVRVILDAISDNDIDAFLVKYPSVVINREREHSSNEGWRHLKQKDYTVQEFITGHLVEARLLLTVTKNVVYTGFMLREKIGGTYKQATGDFNISGTVMPINQSPTIRAGLIDILQHQKYADHFDAIALFLERLGITYGSIDLFFRLNDRDEVIGWGVFEYSSEFAYTSFNAKHVAEMNLAWYEDQVRRYLETL